MEDAFRFRQGSSTFYVQNSANLGGQIFEGLLYRKGAIVKNWKFRRFLLSPTQREVSRDPAVYPATPQHTTPQHTTRHHTTLPHPHHRTPQHTTPTPQHTIPHPHHTTPHPRHSTPYHTHTQFVHTCFGTNVHVFVGTYVFAL